MREFEKAASVTGYPPRYSLASYWRLDCRKEPAREQLLEELRDIPEVGLGYFETPATDPVVNPGDDTFAATQNYLDAAPGGVDARWAWTQANGEGASVKVIDLEQGWFLSHEDLPGPTLLYNDNRDGVGAYVGNHGTAVVGEIAGVDNTVGIVGISPSIQSIDVVSHYNATLGTTGHVADAIVAAIPNLSPGDIVLLEIQRNFLPTETDEADLDAIRLATALGIIVVEAAGNGNNDLDGWIDASNQNRMNRTSPQFVDSGAIMVGASLSNVSGNPPGHDRWGFSNFGTRIDCYGWGEDIVSAGYGDLDAGTGNNSTYTNTFGGTSGASPMIVGIAAIIQGMNRSNTGATLSPGQMRMLLGNPAFGTPQDTGVAGFINVMPDLNRVISNGLGIVPDVYLRDNVTDDWSHPR